MKFRMLSLKKITVLYMLVQSNIAISEPIYKIYDKKVELKEFHEKNKSEIFEMEKKKYDMIRDTAYGDYLNAYWKKYALTEKLDGVEAAKNHFFQKKINITDQNISDTIEKFKENPRLKKLPKKEQESQVREYLESNEKRMLTSQIIDQGIEKKELVILATQPVEPLFDLKVFASDHVKYGPKDSDIKPISCKGDDCTITIIEFSEFQCPYCARILPEADKIMEKYAGKIRWITRDYLIPNHPRARPSAIAAKCASEQNKYWEMYRLLFENQQNLEDDDLVNYGKKIGLNMDEFNKCQTQPQDMEILIAKNMLSASEVGVSSTPTFFINGKRVAGAIPFSAFDQMISEELKNMK